MICSKCKKEFIKTSKGSASYCKGCKKEYDRNWYLKNLDTNRAKRKIYSKTNQYKEYFKNYQKDWRYKNKIDAMTYYSNGMPVCKKCGFTDIRALSIDHINGGGNKHRKELKSDSRIYTWLKQNSFPEGFQVLCMNCQFIKRHENNEQN